MNEWSYTSTPPLRLLSTNRDNTFCKTKLNEASHFSLPLLFHISLSPTSHKVASAIFLLLTAVNYEVSRYDCFLQWQR